MTTPPKFITILTLALSLAAPGCMTAPGGKLPKDERSYYRSLHWEQKRVYKKAANAAWKADRPAAKLARKRFKDCSYTDTDHQAKTDCFTLLHNQITERRAKAKAAGRRAIQGR